MRQLPPVADGKLMGRGLGYVDVHLLAAVMLDQGARLWTRETRLAVVATELGVAYDAESDA